VVTATTIRRVALVLLSAAMFAACFPPLHLRALAWVALVPLLLALRDASMPHAAGLGFLWAMAMACGITDWLPPAIALYYEQPLWLGIAMFLAATATMVAVHFAAFGAFYSLLGRRFVRGWPFLIAAGWVAAELGRSRLLTGNPWGLLGYTQVGIDPNEYGGYGALALSLLQGADVGGIYVTSFLLMAGNAAIVQAWWAWRGRRALTDGGAELGGDTATGDGAETGGSTGIGDGAEAGGSTGIGDGAEAGGSTGIGDGVVAHGGSDWRESLQASAAVLVLIGAAVAYGGLRLQSRFDSAGASVPIAVVQANVDLGYRWQRSHYGKNLEAYLDLTRQALDESDARLVVWPENAMTFFIDRRSDFRWTIADVTEPAGIELVAGGPRYVENAGERTRYYNSAFALTPQGEVAGIYDKEHLLPFAEYFPFGSIELLRRNFGRVAELTSGERIAPLPTMAGPAAVTICNEVMFPRIVRERVRQGASYILNLANDGWMRSHEFAEHQLALAAVRAVEFRRPLVRASTSGPSAGCSRASWSAAREGHPTRSWEMRSRWPACWSWWPRRGDHCVGRAANGGPSVPIRPTPNAQFTPRSRSPQYCARKAFLSGLPSADSGIDSAMSTDFGACTEPFALLTIATISSTSTVSPGRGTTTALTASPQVSSGTPITATCATDG
jgi:apolipoprotein N-acyltransferase